MVTYLVICYEHHIILPNGELHKFVLKKQAGSGPRSLLLLINLSILLNAHGVNDETMELCSDITGAKLQSSGA